MISTILYGFVARVISPFITVKPKHWVLGADGGKTYRESSKYLLEYILKEHPDYHCTFITQSHEVYEDLKRKKIPCLINNSLKGILTISQAQAVFTTQSTADVRFAYKKKGRKYYYMLHGMSQKRSWNQLPDDYTRKLQLGDGLIAKFRKDFSRHLTIGYTIDDVPMVCSCSDFLVPFVKLDFGEKDVQVVGMPRNDALFDHERMKQESWVAGTEGKFVITYMPTHRAYGAGEITPTPFANRPEIQQWMKDNQVVLLMKNHPNMIPRLKDVKDTEVLKDITKLRLDPQVCIYHSDVLITDFSSVWMDYLLLNRPIIFYHYDNFEKDDVGTYYDIKEDKIGHYCYSEDELFLLIQKIKADYEEMKPAQSAIQKYHKYIDGNSCQRYFDAVVENLKK